MMEREKNRNEIKMNCVQQERTCGVSCRSIEALSCVHVSIDPGLVVKRNGK